MKFTLFIMIFFLVSCLPDSNNSSTEPATFMLAEESADIGGGSMKRLNSPAAAPISNDESMERKIIKTGSITIETNSLKDQKKVSAYINELIKNFNAVVEGESQNNWGSQSTISLNLRIPAENLEKFINSLEGSDFKVTNKSLNTTEVTDRYIDHEVRLRNKKELLEKYRELLKKASKIEDILKINQSIESTTSQIEVVEGQFRYLKKQIAMSSLHIQIQALLPATTGIKSSFFSDFWKSLNTGLVKLRNFSLYIASVWPFVIIIVLGLFGFKKWRARRKK